MNANEALRKIAEALNIVDAEPKVENVEQPVEEQPVENVIEEQTEVVEVNEEQPSDPEQQAENVEQPDEQVEVEQPKNDERVAELERQLADLKEILKNAFTQEPEVETPVVEAPVQKSEEPKGLTHSPEKPVKPQVKGIGNKGSDIMNRVFKYMNN